MQGEGFIYTIWYVETKPFIYYFVIVYVKNHTHIDYKNENTLQL